MRYHGDTDDLMKATESIAPVVIILAIIGIVVGATFPIWRHWIR